MRRLDCSMFTLTWHTISIEKKDNKRRMEEDSSVILSNLTKDNKFEKVCLKGQGPFGTQTRPALTENYCFITCAATAIIHLLSSSYSGGILSQ